MSRQAGLAAAALAALLAAGCGGGSTAVAKPAKPDAAAVLQRYMDAMEPHERRFAALTRGVLGVLRGLNGTKPDPSWGQAAQRLAATSGDYGTLAVEISKVKAPPPLEHVHEQLAEAVDSFGTYVFQIETALQAGIPTLLSSAAAADTTGITKARSDWSISVERDATRLGVPIPQWLIPSPAG